MESIIFLALAILIAIIVVLAGVKVVPQSETRVIERLGRFHSVLPPGLNIIWPFIDKPKVIYTRRVESAYGGRTIVRMTATSSIDLREQVYDFPSKSSPRTTSPPKSTLYYTSKLSTPRNRYTKSTTFPTPSRNLPRPHCATSSANSNWTRHLQAATPSTAACKRYSMKPQINGA